MDRVFRPIAIMSPHHNSARGIVTVSILERNETLRHNLSVVLSRCPGVVVLDLCAGLEQGKRCIHERKPSVLVVGDKPADGDDWDMLIAARSLAPNAFIIAISDLCNSDHLKCAFRQGAVSYLLRSTAAIEIHQALVAVTNGGAWMSPSLSLVLVRSIAEPRKPSSRLTTLSKREHEVLKLLSSGARYSEVANQLELSRDTVHSHVKQIYRKLVVRSKTEASLIFNSSYFPDELARSA